MKYYTGIGSRSTPEHILTLMSKIGKYLAQKGYVLRSGGTAMAIKLAKKREIPVINLANQNALNELAKFLKQQEN